MNPEMQKEVLARLDALAAKLGMAAGELWRMYLRQARIEAVKDTLWAAITLAALGALAWWFQRAGSFRDADDRVFARICSWIGIAICAFLLASCVSDAVTEWCNPGFWAWQALFAKLT